MVVEIDQAFLDGATQRIEQWAQDNDATNEMIMNAVHDLTRPTGASPAQLASGYDLALLIRQMAREHAVRDQPLTQGKPYPVVTLEEAKEQQKRTRYVIWRILYECVPGVAVSLMEKEHETPELVPAS